MRGLHHRTELLSSTQAVWENKISPDSILYISSCNCSSWLCSCWYLRPAGVLQTSVQSGECQTRLFPQSTNSPVLLLLQDNSLITICLHDLSRLVFQRHVTKETLGTELKQKKSTLPVPWTMPIWKPSGKYRTVCCTCCINKMKQNRKEKGHDLVLVRRPNKLVLLGLLFGHAMQESVTHLILHWIGKWIRSSWQPCSNNTE